MRHLKTKKLKLLNNKTSLQLKMINNHDIEIQLAELKDARENGLPIAEWRQKALNLFEIFCRELTTSDSRKAENKNGSTLSRRLAFDCRAELENYFVNFGYDDKEESDRWAIISEQLKTIYLS